MDHLTPTQLIACNISKTLSKIRDTSKKLNATDAKQFESIIFEVKRATMHNSKGGMKTQVLKDTIAKLPDFDQFIKKSNLNKYNDLVEDLTSYLEDLSSKK